MPWFWLFLAGLLRIGLKFGLRHTASFARPGASLVTIALMVACFLCPMQAGRVQPLGTSYAVWTGTGAVGTAIAGMATFREPATAARLVCIGLIVLGIIGLKLTIPAAGDRSAGGPVRENRG